MRHRTSLSVVLALLGLAAVANAQVSVNANVQGTVADPSGAVIPGAAVTATNVNTGIVTNRQSNATGDYQFQALQPGNYTLSASYQGFQTQTFQNLQLSQGQSVRLNFNLQPATANTSVEVVAEASTIIAETSPSVENTIQERSVLNFPVQTRNVLDQLGTTPGVVVANGIFGNATPQMSGTTAGGVNTTRDGLITNDGRYNAFNGAYSSSFTSPDMVEEVRVSTNSIDPTVGRGSAQVQMRTRAGTNDYHGALFYTNNNSYLQSRDYFAALRGADRSYQNRNQFGGRLGGSIIKNKAFFFVLVDNQRYLTKQLVTSQVLTPEARTGVFRYLADMDGTVRRNGNALGLGSTRSVDLQGNVLTSDPVDGSALQMRSFNVFNDIQDPFRTGFDSTWVTSQWLPRMPMPNDWSVGDGLNTAGFRWLQPQNGSDGATGASPNPNRDHLTTRFDYQLNDGNRLTYTGTREVDKSVTGQTGLAAYPGGYQGALVRTPNFQTVAWSSAISPTILSEFRFGYKQDTWIGVSPFDTGYNFGNDPNAVDATAQNARDSYPQNQGQFVYINPSIATSYSNLNVSTPRATYSPLKQIADTISFSRGAHSFQAGFQFNWFNSKSSNAGGQQTTRPYASLGQNNVAVPLNPSAFPGLSTFDVSLAQNLLANLAGSVDNITQQAFVNSPTQQSWSTYVDGFLYNRNIHQNDWNLFFKDTWKVSQNLTLTLGLRYDKYGTPYDSYGLGGRFTGGQSALFGISGTSFANGWWSPGIMNGSPTGIEFVGKDSPQPGKTIFGNDWNNIAPSLGFSYDLNTFGKPTVIRGGYGINYSGSPNFLGYSANIGSLPGTTQLQTANFAQNDFLTVSGLSNQSLLPLVPTNAPFQTNSVTDPTGRAQSITGYNDNYRIPYIQSFNLSVTRELAEGLTLEVGWVGNKATKLWDNFQINDINIFETGLLNAFNTTAQGGNAQLFDQMLAGVAFPKGTVGQNNFTGSDALRSYNTTNSFLANGRVAELGDFLYRSASFTGANGGLLRSNGFPENFFVANPQFNGVNLYGNNNNSTYHSLQFTLNQRYKNGFSWQFSYVFSKNLGLNGVRDPRNRNLSKGILGMNRPHIFKFNGVWDLPFGQQGQMFRSAPRWLDSVIGGWTLSPVVQWTSGSPMSFNFGTFGSTAGMSSISYQYRTQNSPDLVATVNNGAVAKSGQTVSYLGQYTVTKAPYTGDPTIAGRFTNNIVTDQNGNTIMQAPKAGTVGNLNQNVMTGPGQLTFNTSVSKKVYLNESMYFTLRADVINVLNKPQWNNPNTNINSGSFGQITGAGGQRAVTLNARFDF